MLSVYFDSHRPAICQGRQQYPEELTAFDDLGFGVAGLIAGIMAWLRGQCSAPVVFQLQTA
jgi:hypothetical protein